MKLYTLTVDIWDESLMWSDDVCVGFVVARATGQDEAAIALDRRSSSVLNGESRVAAGAAAGRADPAGLVPEVPLCSSVAAAAAAAALPAHVRIIL